MIRSLLCVLFVGTTLALPGDTAADESRAATFGGDLQALAAHNLLLMEQYNSAMTIIERSDLLIDSIDGFWDSTLTTDDLRKRMRQQIVALETDISQLDASLASLPKVPAARSPMTKDLALSVGVFHQYVQSLPSELRQRLRLLEQLAAAAMANDVDHYEELRREHIRFLAQQIEGETAMLRIQLGFMDPKNFATPLHRCIIHINEAWGDLTRSWADVGSIDLKAAMMEVSQKLDQAEAEIQNGEHRLEEQHRFFEDRGLPTATANSIKEALENMRQTYLVETEIVAVTRKFGAVLAEAEAYSDALEQSYEEYWQKTSELAVRRGELYEERQEIAGRIGAGMQ